MCLVKITYIMWYSHDLNRAHLNPEFMLLTIMWRIEFPWEETQSLVFTPGRSLMHFQTFLECRACEEAEGAILGPKHGGGVRGRAFNVQFASFLLLPPVWGPQIPTAWEESQEPWGTLEESDGLTTNLCPWGLRKRTLYKEMYLQIFLNSLIIWDKTPERIQKYSPHRGFHPSPHPRAPKWFQFPLYVLETQVQVFMSSKEAKEK